MPESDFSFLAYLLETICKKHTLNTGSLQLSKSMNSLTGALLMLVLSLKLCLPLLSNFSDRINPVVLEQSEEKKSESTKEDFKILSSYLISNQLQSVDDTRQFGAAIQNPDYVNSHSFEVIVPPPDTLLSFE